MPAYPGFILTLRLGNAKVLRTQAVWEMKTRLKQRRPAKINVEEVIVTEYIIITLLEILVYYDGTLYFV